MNDAFGMRGIERVGNFDGERQQRVQFQRAPRDQVLQGHAIEKLHGDKRLAILLADVVDGADVGMVQRGCGLRLALKAAERLRILGDFIGQKLEGDEAVQPRVFGFVDHTHPAAAQLLDDAVVRDGLSDHGFRRSEKDEAAMLGGAK